MLNTWPSRQVLKSSTLGFQTYLHTSSVFRNVRRSLWILHHPAGLQTWWRFSRKLVFTVSSNKTIASRYHPSGNRVPNFELQRVPVPSRARHADSRHPIQGYSTIRVRWQLELRFIRGPQGSSTLIKNCLQPPAKLRSLFTTKYYLTCTSICYL